jgi:hypothetical protein
MIYLGLLLVGVALVLFWLSARQRRASGSPAGKILYQDTGLWHKVEKPLFDPQLNLTGKPDYLVEQDGVWIPVEVKSRPAFTNWRLMLCWWRAPAAPVRRTASSATVTVLTSSISPLN